MIVLSSKVVIARKEHKCQLCCCKIEIGKRYNNQFNKQDDCVYTFKNHIHCQEIASKLKMYDYCDYGLNDEGFYESIKEEFIRLMEIHESEVFNYDFYQYPIFPEQLKYVCEMNKIELS